MFSKQPCFTLFNDQKLPSTGQKGGTEGLVMFTKTRFTACMKGIIDIQGRLTEPFCLVVALAAHKPDYDKDFTQVTKILFS